LFQAFAIVVVAFAVVVVVVDVTTVVPQRLNHSFGVGK
jgi:hypothetical protein